MVNLGRLRQVILRDAISIASQERALVVAVRWAVVAAFALGMLELLLVVSSASTALLTVFGLLELGAITTVGVIGYIAYTTLRESALRPLDELTAVARQIGGGDLLAEPQPQRSPEMQQIATTLGTLSKAVLAERRHRVADRRAGQKENTSLRQILSITRTVGSSLERDVILAELSSGARKLSGFSDVVVWRFNELDSEVEAMYPPRAVARFPRPQAASMQPAGRAATSAQTVRLRAEKEAPPGLAVPLMVGLQVLGVLELRGENTEAAMVADPIDALEALASHAATALAAAALHEQLEQRKEQFEQRSETDPLTGVFNRRKMDSDLRNEVQRSLRYGHPLTLLMVDIDHFKSINDQLGHQTGDDVLKAVATALALGRQTDSAYRFGGEEFAVILRATDAAAGHGVAERIRTRVTEAVAPLGLERDVTASLGVASMVGPIKTAEQLIEAADVALYQAKQRGRNQVVVSATATVRPE